MRPRSLACLLLIAPAACSPPAAPAVAVAPTVASATIGAPTIAPPARFPLPERLPARYLRTLEYDPGGYDIASPPGGPARGDPTDLLLGDLLFHSPSTLGARARQMGISCQSCHPNGATNAAFSIPGLGDRPGNIDLTTRFFRPGAADDRDDPVNIPSLRGARFTAPYGHDGRTASLAEFVQGVVAGEFDGDPLPPRELAALVRYVEELDFLPNAALDEQGHLRAPASEAALRGEAIFVRPMRGFDGKSCASCHEPGAFFRDGRVHRVGSGPGLVPHALDDGYETPTLLGLAESAPYFHDGRFATLGEVVRFFDDRFALGLSDAERADLTAYVEVVGAVDRPVDDRPIARKLSQAFAYAGLLADPIARIREAAREALLVELAAAPAELSARAATLRARIQALPIAQGPIALPQARALRRELTILAADWGGVLSARGQHR
ncbi:MAG: hypothetical protein U0359_27635 [Byssovorax sp.]